MGSGSRIDHQTHPIATTAPAPGPVTLTPVPDTAAAGDQPMLPDPEQDLDGVDDRARLIANLQEAGRRLYEDPTPDGAAELNPAVARAAARDVLADIAAETAESATAQAAAAARDEDPQEESDERYSENMTAFQRDYRAARARLAAGEPAVEYMREDATGGLGARDGGRGFGVELEFDLPGLSGQDVIDARAAIARDMYAAGLSRSADVGGYHVAQRQGYSDDPGRWSFESDSTVSGGEIVSPIMYDTPQTWANLEQVCDIIARHGGRATFRTGGHVHVSAGDYDHTVENHSRLMNTIAAYEDIYYRLGQNPAAEAHRGTRWCRPNDVPSDGYASVDQVRWYNDGHHLAVNMESIRGHGSDHVEFRMFDGSLNPAVIQTQIKVALGTVDAAFRQARLPEAPAGGRRHRLGEHRRAYGRRRQTGEAWRQATAAFRSFADTVFSRPADRAQAASLFAATHWQRG